MSCQNQHFLCNIIPIGHLKDPFLDKQSPTILMTLNILMTIVFYRQLEFKTSKKKINILETLLLYMQKNVEESKFTYCTEP